MASVTQLPGGAPQAEEPLSSPEVLVLNALIKTKRFDPEAYGLDEDMLASHQLAWQFCLDHQVKTGKAPSQALFARSHPDVEILGGEVDPHWAASKLKEAHYEREVRRGLNTAVRHMREGNFDLVREAVRELALPNPLSKPQGVSITDIETVAASGVKIGFNTPWPTLTAATNGHGRGEFLLLGARLGQGKSWLAPGYMLAAASMGARVAVMSCEMPVMQYARRIHAWQAPDAATLKLLRSAELEDRAKGLHALPPLAGAVDIYDPSIMRMNLRSVESLAAEYDLVWIDHVGLLADHHGKRAIEDWRIAAIISNTLKETALRFNTAIGAAVQINRAGETASSAPPKVSDIAQTDALGQDADLVITLKRMGERSMLHNLAKNREGHAIRFYTQFEPATASFKEITGDEARLRGLEDQDRTANL